MSKQTKVGRHASPETGDAGRSGSFAEELIDVFASKFVASQSATEREARETVNTAGRVVGKVKGKSDYWLRLSMGVIGIWMLLAIGVSIIPFEPGEQFLMVLGPLAIIFAWFHQPSIATGAFLWEKTRGVAETVAVIALFQTFAGFAIWAIPLHAAREMVVPFMVLLFMIGLSYLISGKKAVRTFRNWVLIPLAVIMAAGFFAADDAVETRVTTNQATTYTQLVATTPPHTSGTERVSPSPTTRNSQQDVQPTSNAFPDPGPSLSIWAEPSPYVAQPGEMVRITVVVGNHGRGDAKNPTVTVELPQGLVFAETGTRTQSWELDDIPKNVGERSISMTIQVEITTPPGGYDFVVRANAENLPQEFSVPHSLVVNAP